MNFPAIRIARFTGVNRKHWVPVLFGYSKKTSFNKIIDKADKDDQQLKQ